MHEDLPVLPISNLENQNLEKRIVSGHTSTKKGAYVMNCIKGIIFDLDGVIVFTDELHFQAWNKLAKDLGIYFDREINNLLRGVSRMESLEIVLREYRGRPLSDSEKAALAEKKNDIYKGLLEGMKPEDVSDEVRSSLRELARRGFKLAVGSSSKNTKRILEKVELTGMFDAVSDGTNIQKSKPDPEVFIKAAQFLGLEPQQCLVVEDADAGVEAAIAAGMYSAALRPAAESGKADYLLKDFTDLLNITALERTEGDC